MRPDIRPGGIFPDYALPDHTGTTRSLSELQGRDPLILTLARGNYCPKEHQQHLELAANYPKIAVAYTQVVTIATDDHHVLQEFRASVGAQWTFLSDPGRTVQQDLDIQEYTDPEHNPMIPHTLVLKPGLVVHSVYNGYWFWGRPSFYELWRDLRAATSEVRPDWDLSTPGLREAWDAGDYSHFHGWDRSRPSRSRRPTSSDRAGRRGADREGAAAVRTPVCEMLGIEQPIVQAPMAAVPALAAAVSNAGALGMVTLTWSDDVGAVVRETAGLTARPFGGNFVLTSDHHRRLDEALEAGLRIVSFFWGTRRLRRGACTTPAGIVLHTVGSAEEARRAVDAGVDVIVAQGWEAGGHVGSQVATLPLVPAVVDAVTPVPVIAAGGIGDAPRRRRGARPGRPGGVAGHAVPAGRGDADPRGLPARADRRGRDRRPVVPQPVRRGLAGRAAPRAAQLHRPGRGRPRAARRTRSGRDRARSSRTSRPASPSSATSRRRRWSARPVTSRRCRCGPGRASRWSREPQPAAEIVTELTSRL